MTNQPRIPPMNDLLSQGQERGLDGHGRPALRAALSRALDRLRERWRNGDTEAGIGEPFWQETASILAIAPALKLRRAVNATGVVLHTGLGRAPWPSEATAAVLAVSRSAMVEIDRPSGRRGRREHAVVDLLQQITGAEDAVVVNNNAAAVLLSLAALAGGRKVVMARGEMVEIGGSYRLPEVVAAAGATLLEVGTTNRVHRKDFEAALADPEVACVIKVHPSNFKIEGFHSELAIDELSGLCREHGVPLVYDLGSGVLSGSDLPVVCDEPAVRDALKAGADLVTFSGDKLLGGPQAGLIVGAAPLVERLRRHMLMRCLRLDKAMLAALEAVLLLHALGEESASQRIPALRMIAAGPEQLRPRAEHIVQMVQAHQSPLRLEVVDSDGRVGSGAAPEAPLPGSAIAVELEGVAAEELAKRLRVGEPPVFARVHDGRVLLDLRTVEPDEEKALLRALARLGA